jgi:TRAP transporter TAXI family solute receptor
LNSREILKAAGMSYKDLAKVEYLGYSESVELIKNRQLDATLQSSGLGMAAVRDLATAIKMVVIPIPVDVVKKIDDAAYSPGVIPANTYNGQTVDVPTVAVQNYLVTHEGVSTDTVYKMTKSMFENLDAMAAAHGAAKAINPKTAGIGSPVPLHPGAEKYYREAGLIK